MCAISGWAFEVGCEPPAAALAEMSLLIEHRGPDSTGICRDAGRGVVSAYNGNLYKCRRLPHELRDPGRRNDCCRLLPAARLARTVDIGFRSQRGGAASWESAAAHAGSLPSRPREIQLRTRPPRSIPNPRIRRTNNAR